MILKRKQLLVSQLFLIQSQSFPQYFNVTISGQALELYPEFLGIYKKINEISDFPVYHRQSTNKDQFQFGYLYRVLNGTFTTSLFGQWITTVVYKSIHRHTDKNLNPQGYLGFLYKMRRFEKAIIKAFFLLFIETCLILFSLVLASVSSPRFGPKRNPKMPFDHHPPPTANFWKGSRHSRGSRFCM